MSQRHSNLPGIVDKLDVKRFLIYVLVALFPVFLFSFYLYGIKVFYVLGVSYLFGLGTEWLFSRLTKKPILEGSLVTCFLYALILPPTLPLWLVALGIVVAVLVGKILFGGLGRNILNPALVGRCFLHVFFPVQMTQRWEDPLSGLVTQATPLMSFQQTGETLNWDNLLLGTVPGSIGESSAILILVCGIGLVLVGVARWQIVVSCLLGSFLSILMLGSAAQNFLLAFISGGFLFGVFFMATDPVTAPQTNKACWLYGLGIGFLAMWIRYRSNYYEGIMFAILIMNLFAPLLDAIMIKFFYKQKRMYAN